MFFDEKKRAEVKKVFCKISAGLASAHRRSVGFENVATFLFLGN